MFSDSDPSAESVHDCMFNATVTPFAIILSIYMQIYIYIFSLMLNRYCPYVKKLLRVDYNILNLNEKSGKF